MRPGWWGCSNKQSYWQFMASSNCTKRMLAKLMLATKLTTVKVARLPPVLSAKWTSHTVHLIQALHRSNLLVQYELEITTPFLR